MELDLVNCSTILVELRSLPKIKAQDLTYFEIAGYPSLENVTSNILSFFLDPNQSHGLNTLFVESLLIATNQDYHIEELIEIEVEREVYTDKKYRIDLVIESQSIIVGIENKLFANLNNDLENYKQHLLKNAGGKRVIPILLTLFPIDSKKNLEGFISVTYEKYFEVLLSSLGKNLLEANNRYISFFLEFIKTINNLTKETNIAMVNPAFINWLSKNQEDVNLLYQQIGEFKKELTKKAKQLGSLINLEGYEESGVKNTQWIWDAFHYGKKIMAIDLVHDIETRDFPLAIDTMISASGIYMMLSNRKEKGQVLREWLTLNKIPFDDHGEKKAVYGKRFQYSEDIQLVQKQLQDLSDRVLKAVVEERRK
jgi:hypothetical protein